MLIRSNKVLSLLGDKFHEKYTVYHQIKVPKKSKLNNQVENQVR